MCCFQVAEQNQRKLGRFEGIVSVGKRSKVIEHAKRIKGYLALSYWKNRDTISYLKQITKEADAIGKKKKIYLGLCSLCPADSCSDRNDLLL